ncbi:MAG: hypoxanthine-guanine phosphoribosyltransferase [Pseudomonadales bacterium]|nr:hypoxanthine-guanine phosphoribosyltransferase [Pseudomonadales bacterium]
MSTTANEVETIWREADCLWTEQQIERAIEAVAQTIETDLADKDPLVLVVMKGGMIFGARLVMRLRFPLELDYIHATRYGLETQGAELHWKVLPQHPLEGRHVLVVDDILDEGETLCKILQSCRQQQPASLRCTVLVDKVHERKYQPDFKADYTCLEVPDRFVFGYGMDYKGYLRNADGIFAVKGL